jgi:phage baseplate assembly protein W
MSDNIQYAYRRDIPFSLDLDEHGDLRMLEDADAINQSIYTILVSDNASKVMEDNFGANVSESLFESSSPSNFLEIQISDNIQRSITAFEPSVVIEKVSVDMSDMDNNTIKVLVPFLVRDGVTTGLFQEELSIVGKE